MTAWASPIRCRDSRVSAFLVRRGGASGGLEAGIEHRKGGLRALGPSLCVGQGAVGIEVKGIGLEDCTDVLPGGLELVRPGIRAARKQTRVVAAGVRLQQRPCNRPSDVVLPGERLRPGGLELLVGTRLLPVQAGQHGVPPLVRGRGNPSPSRHTGSVVTRRGLVRPFEQQVELA